MDTTKRKALGRGLGALIPGAPRRSEPQAPAPSGPIKVAIGAVVASPFQPRQAFPEASLQELAGSIRQNGVIQPLVVRPRGEGFELIAGERRFRAAQLAGLEEVPVVVREVDDREALELAIIENVQREDLNPLDEAGAYHRLLEEFGLTQEQVADRVGKSRPTVANALRLLSLPPEVQAEIRSGRLTGGHARAIVGAPSATAQVAASREVVRRKLTVRDTEKLVRELSSAPDADRAALEDRLRRALGTKVRLVARANGRGRIEIEYFSLDELDGIISRLLPS